jgi:hypothetical protein
VTNVEGPTGVDAREKDAFVRLLQDPGRLRDPLLREAMESLAAEFALIVPEYKAQYRFEPAYFEAAFRRVGELLDDRLGPAEARETKTALTVVLGGYLANASDDARPGRDHVSEQEVRAITVITHWLGGLAGR